MTDKITRAEAERIAMKLAIMTAFDRGTIAGRYNHDPDNNYELCVFFEMKGNAMHDAENIYAEKLAELAPRIIPENPWRPIEECPSEQTVLFRLRGCGLIVSGHRVAGGFRSDNGPHVNPDFFMEIPALLDEVA